MKQFTWIALLMAGALGAHAGGSGHGSYQHHHSSSDWHWGTSVGFSIGRIIR